MMKMMLILSALLLAAPTPAFGQAKLGRTRCAILDGPARTYCTQFVTARDSFTKYSVANEWARFATDSCALRAWGCTPRCARRRHAPAGLARAHKAGISSNPDPIAQHPADGRRALVPCRHAMLAQSGRRGRFVPCVPSLTYTPPAPLPSNPKPPRPQLDLCSGISALCLNQDIQAPRPNNSSCRVPPEDTPCGDNPALPGYCRAGVCYCARAPRGGRGRGWGREWAADMQLWKGSGTRSGAFWGRAGGSAHALPRAARYHIAVAHGGPTLCAHPRPLPPPSLPGRRPADMSGIPVPSRADVETALLERARAFEAPKTTTFYPQQTQLPLLEPGDGSGGGGGGEDTSPFGPDLNMTVWVDTDTIGRFVPASFVGISREYTNESVYWDRNLPAWGAILDVLGPSPIVRLGGASQEALTAPPTADYLRSLVTLHCALGVRYIVGLPLYQNAPALALTIKQAFDKAFSNFPRAILSYELGNEVRGGGGGVWGCGRLLLLSFGCRVPTQALGGGLNRGPACQCAREPTHPCPCCRPRPHPVPSPTTGRPAQRVPSSGAPARQRAPKSSTQRRLSSCPTAPAS
jgi:hypothetical protein